MTTATFPPRLQAVALIVVVLFLIDTYSSTNLPISLFLDKYSYAFNVLEAAFQ